MSRRYRWIAAAIVSLGAITSILSATVAAVALPTFQRVFGASLSDVQWILSGYQLGLAAVIPVSGYLSDRFGTKRIFIITLTLFVLTSLLSGVAWSINSLIALRVIQGMAGGMVMPVGMTMLLSVTPAQERGRMMGTLGVPMLLGPALGPTVGGWLLEVGGWRWIFWMNVPTGVLAIILGSYYLRSLSPRRRESLDLVGLFLATPGVTAVIFGLTQTSSHGWTSPWALLPILGGLLVILAFVLWELRRRHPLLDLRVFRDKGFSAAMVGTVVLSMSLFGAVFLVPLYLQEVQGKDPLHAGLLLAGQGVGAGLMMPLSGWLTDRYGARPVVLTGMTVLAGVTYLMSSLSPNTSDQTWFLLLVLRGVGMGCSMMPAVSSAYARLGAGQIARATAVSNTIQRLGSSLGIAVMATVAESRIVAHIHQFYPQVAAVAGTANLGQLSPALHARLAHAVTLGFSDTFLFSAGLALLGLPVAMQLRRAARGDGTDSEPLPRRDRVVTWGLAVFAAVAFILTTLVAFGIV